MLEIVKVTDKNFTAKFSYCLLNKNWKCVTYTQNINTFTEILVGFLTKESFNYLFLEDSKTFLVGNL